MTVGELAFSMKIGLKAAKQASRTKSASAVLANDELDATLSRLEETLGFHSKGWDLSELDGIEGEWADTLRKLYSIPVSFPASLPPSQGKQVRELILRESPERVLEIGCFIGISSHWIASALDDQGFGILDSVDTFWPKYPNRFHFSYLAAPYDCATSFARGTRVGQRITFHHRDSTAYGRSLATRGDRYDFMFIDGNHTFEGVTRDFFTYFPLLKNGGVILLHDTHPNFCGWEGPRKLIDQILLSFPQVTIEEIDTRPNYGMAVIRKLSDTPLSLSPAQRVAINARLMNEAIKSQLLQSPLTRTLLRSFIKPAIARFKYS